MSSEIVSSLCSVAGLIIVFVTLFIKTPESFVSREGLFRIGIAILGALIMLGGARLKPQDVERDASQRSFTETLTAAYPKLKNGEKISGKEYLALEAMTHESDLSQLKEVAKALGVDPQEIIALVADSDRISVQREDAKPWDGKIVHHL